jgi:Na+/H+-dicarboxylate symporter
MSESHATSPEWRFLGMNMWQMVLLGLVGGILTGYVLGENAAVLSILGIVFIKLIKMVVAPLILFALIQGITSLTESHHFGGIAIRGAASYVLTALISVAIGLFLANLFQPGVGMDPVPLEDASSVGKELPDLGAFFMELIPANIITSMAQDHYIQIVIFAIFTGIVMNNIRGNTAGVKEINKELTHIVFKMIEWIVRLAPLAVFGFMASMIGTTKSWDVLLGLMNFSLVVMGAIMLQYVVLGLVILVFARVSPFPFYKKMFTTQIMAFSTSSSKATLTTAMRELQDKVGVSQSTTNFMMPLGACINMDGTAIYLGITAVFFAQMYGISLDMSDYFLLIFTCTLGSIGAAGIPSGSIIFMGMVLSTVGIPLEGIALILGVDRILDMFRTMINVTSDSAITLVMDSVDGEFDRDVYYDKSR